MIKKKERKKSSKKVDSYVTLNSFAAFTNCYRLNNKVLNCVLTLTWTFWTSCKQSLPFCRKCAFKIRHWGEQSSDEIS